MNEIDVARREIANCLSSTFVPNTKTIGKVDPKGAILNNNILLSLWILPNVCGTLYGNAIVIRVNETVPNSVIAGIARIDAIVISASGTADAQVANEHLVTTGRSNRPVPCSADDNAFD